MYHDYGELVRVESGPARLKAKATEELLDDAVTARKYQVGAFDAAGERIVLGKEMTYLDHKADSVWNVYGWVPSPDDDPDDGLDGRWIPQSSWPTFEEAEAAAKALQTAMESE